MEVARRAKALLGRLEGTLKEQSKAPSAVPLTPLRLPCDGPNGLVLALNVGAVSYVQSVWSEKYKQHLLRVVLGHGQVLLLFAADAPDMLRELGLHEYASDWTLNLERDIA